MTTHFETAGDARIAVCFFGITRSLEHTLGSIREHVLEPARRVGSIRVFTHLFRIERIDNARSGESAGVPQGQHELLSSDWLRLEEPGACLEARGFEAIAAHGDFWNDGFQSLRNLVHQLHSLDVVTEAALAWEPDVVVFCRPDLRYLDSLEPWLERAVAAEEPAVWLPSWQHWGGFNDRFAVCAGERAACAYGRRVSGALEFVVSRRRPLHGERLLAWSLRREGVPVRLMGTRAVRVRVGGAEVRERFLPGWVDLFDEAFWGAVSRARRVVGV